MNINMGSQTFLNVTIPILWGTRAILQSPEGKLSVIDLSGESARLEILEDGPAKGVEFAPTAGGFIIKRDFQSLYTFNVEEHSLTSDFLKLPDLYVSKESVKVGGGIFSNNMMSGMGVGIIATEQSIGMGAPLPPNLAKLIV